MNVALGLILSMVPVILWCSLIGYFLGFKVTIVLLLVIPTLIISFICKMIARVLLNY